MLGFDRGEARSPRRLVGDRLEEGEEARAFLAQLGTRGRGGSEVRRHDSCGAGDCPPAMRAHTGASTLS
jgi:hypothetical protein